MENPKILFFSVCSLNDLQCDSGATALVIDIDSSSSFYLYFYHSSIVDCLFIGSDKWYNTKLFGVKLLIEFGLFSIWLVEIHLATSATTYTTCTLHVI